MVYWAHRDGKSFPWARYRTIPGKWCDPSLEIPGLGGFTMGLTTHLSMGLKPCLVG